MSKTHFALSISSLLAAQLFSFAWAAEPAAKSSTTTPDANATTTATPAASAAAGKHGHDHPFGKKFVLGLSSLTAKQKEQINAVYDANSKQWQDLEKQMHDLHEAEWTKIKPILTADQLTALRSAARAHGGGKGKGAGKTGSAAPDAGDAN
jgi:hypothetical protein